MKGNALWRKELLTTNLASFELKVPSHKMLIFYRTKCGWALDFWQGSRTLPKPQPQVLSQKHCHTSRRRIAVQMGSVLGASLSSGLLEARRAQRCKWGRIAVQIEVVLQYFSYMLYGLGLLNLAQGGPFGVQTNAASVNVHHMIQASACIARTLAEMQHIRIPWFMHAWVSEELAHGIFCKIVRCLFLQARGAQDGSTSKRRQAWQVCCTMTTTATFALQPFVPLANFIRILLLAARTSWPSADSLAQGASRRGRTVVQSLSIASGNFWPCHYFEMFSHPA